MQKHNGEQVDYGPGPHRERWKIWTCSIIRRHIFLGLRLQDGGCESEVAMSCYRSLLCESEDRDCWFAQPTVSYAIPFDYEDAEAALKARGIVFSQGMDPLVLLEQSSLDLDERIIMLKELLVHQDLLLAAANYDPGKANELIRRLETQKSQRS